MLLLGNSVPEKSLSANSLSPFDKLRTTEESLRMTYPRSILVLYAHPNPAQSHAQKILLAAIQNLEGVVVHDLYRMYPHFYIDPAAEQKALRQADLIIFQHPFYWYSVPALLKEWLDIVLERGFAYGPGGTLLQGKDFLQVVSFGNREASYQRSGGNRFTLTELLRPFEATAQLCGLKYHKPFTVQAGSYAEPAQLQARAEAYRQLLIQYRNEGPVALEPMNSAQEAESHD
jgi:putative NADPH-quinone reductase